MATPTVYVFCDNNCKFESMTKEQILSAIMQAVASGEIKDVDAGFISTVKTINGISLKFFYGEQSAYDALSDEEKKQLFPIITNDTSAQEMRNAINGIIDGTTPAAYANRAGGAEIATTAQHAEKADEAANANAVNGVAITRAENGNLTFGENIVEVKKLVYDSVPVAAGVSPAASISAATQHYLFTAPSAGREYEVRIYDGEKAYCFRFLPPIRGVGFSLVVKYYDKNNDGDEVIFAFEQKENNDVYFQYACEDTAARSLMLIRIYDTN